MFEFPSRPPYQRLLRSEVGLAPMSERSSSPKSVAHQRHGGDELYGRRMFDWVPDAYAHEDVNLSCGQMHKITFLAPDR